MIFSVILFALAGVVAFFQYVQGFFSATISAILAIIAAIVAMGWYEQAAPLLFNAKIYDQAASISLVVIFAVVYILPRLLIDSFVPGNVRVPFLVEKIGAGAMGLIAGLVCTGIVAVAADALPFGSTIGMYSRFGTTDQKDAMYAGPSGQMLDTQTHDVFTGDKIDPEDSTESHVWLGQDDLVVNWAKKASGPDGSLANDRPMAAVHPDLLDELYGQRLGIQPGAKHTAVNTDQTQLVTVKGIYTPPRPIPQVDGEPLQMRISGAQPPASTVAADGDQIVLVVRMNFAGKDLADDTDNLLRYSAGAIRLVVGEPDNGAPFKNYYPVATLDARGTAVACRPDDFLLSDMAGPRTVDFVFIVDRDHVMGGDETKPPFHLPAGAFVEFKRYGLCDVSGKTVEFGPPPNSDKTPVIRKPMIDTVLAKTDGLWTGAAPVVESAGGSTGGGSNSQVSASDNNSSGGGAAEAGGDHPLGDSGLSYIAITASNKLAAPINCGTGDDTGTVQLANGVGGELSHRQWTQLTVSADTPVSQLGQPQSDDVSELGVDPNTVLIQVECSAPVSGSGSQIWAWGKRVSDFALADATGSTYPCIGVWATVQRGADHYFVANYKNLDDKNHLQAIVPPKKGRPVNVWLAFQVPAGTPIAEIRFSANTAMDNLNFKAP
jgi:uncharacterized membrane protein required for colicin V production